MTKFSYLAFLATDFGKTQARLFRLNEEFGVPAADLADIFSLPLEKVTLSLIRARRATRKPAASPACPGRPDHSFGPSLSLNSMPRAAVGRTRHVAGEGDGQLLDLPGKIVVQPSPQAASRGFLL
jgi:hypothetical protein